MNTIKEKLDNLNELVISGKLLEAFDTHYHDSVSMQENFGPVTVGKDANRKREEEFLNSIVEFRNAEVLDIAIGDNVSFVKWRLDYTHKEWGVKDYTQVSVQHWKDGKIVNEQFFYGN